MLIIKLIKKLYFWFYLNPLEILFRLSGLLRFGFNKGSK
jgi:hypothetical protein